MKLDLQTRDRKTGAVRVTGREIDPREIGVVVVDPWNWHWCMTATQRFVAMGPRLGKALEGVRELGMQVFWCPTDVASQYCGWPQRERAIAVVHREVPKARELVMPIDIEIGPCMCGPGIPCKVNYGWDGMNPALHIAAGDLIANDTDEIYSLIMERGLKLLIYMGGHTNMCLLGKPPALRNMYNAGIDCCVARDLNDAFSNYSPEKSFTPDDGTSRVVEQIEMSGIPTIDMVEELEKARAWETGAVVEMVRISPWGTDSRPYLFENEVTVTMRIPRLTDAEIRYTTDGTEPDERATIYTGPFDIAGSRTVRAAAFTNGRRASLTSDARFDRLPSMPPKPDVYLDRLPPLPELYGASSSARSIWFWHPQSGRNHEGKPMQIRGKVYDRGIGMRAPAYIRFDVKPEYERFVALAGPDDNLADEMHGRFLAMHTSVVFKVFIDGELAVESPVMRISYEPWRFDVEIPEGSRQIDLVMTDAGSRSACDLGNWVEAGFVTVKP